jgi:flavin-dependent dehydrogenase
VAFVGGADGATSLVRRRLHAPFARAQLSVARGVYAHGITAHDIVVEFVREPAGYAWSFPRADHLAIGVCAQADEADAASLEHRVSRLVGELAGTRLVKLVPYAWPIPSLSPTDFDVEHPAGDRWALVGDAAGLVDPITREGLFFALRSGDLLAEALLRHPAAPARGYLLALQAEVFPELRRSALLKRGFFQGGFPHLLVDALQQSGPVNQIMADLVAGAQPYSTLKRRLVGTFEIRLAWRLLALELRGWLGMARDQPRTPLLPH